LPEGVIKDPGKKDLQFDGKEAHQEKHAKRKEVDRYFLDFLPVHARNFSTLPPIR